LTYALPIWRGGGVRPKLHLDLFHLGNARTVVRRDDVRYIGLDADGNQAEANPVYNRPEVFQPPMSARLGISLDFGDMP
jgi:hypothetical protein